jgi:predicted RNA-binding protein with TRAM domain
LHDDFAFATRESLIPDIKRRDGQAEIEFDFVLTVADAKAGDGVVHRQRVEAAE